MKNKLHQLKPEMEYNRSTGCFTLNGTPLSLDEARACWEALDHDWSLEAFARMFEIERMDAEEQ
jgi:hypothetical protein